MRRQIYTTALTCPFWAFSDTLFFCGGRDSRGWIMAVILTNKYQRRKFPQSLELRILAFGSLKYFLNLLVIAKGKSEIKMYVPDSLLLLNIPKIKPMCHLYKNREQAKVIYEWANPPSIYLKIKVLSSANSLNEWMRANSFFFSSFFP